MSSHMETRKRLKAIDSIEEFNRLLDSAVLADDERQIIVLHYWKKKSLSCIADELGFSESSIKKKHHYILCRLKALMDEEL